MRRYVNSILPRLKEFSATLDRKEIFIEVPWVIIDENLNQQKYIFKRDGVLIMSLNGQVTTGAWEYLFAAKSLLIDRVKDKILLNQDFIDPAVMILKKDGSKDENLILANEILMPDLDVEQYLRKLFYSKNSIFVKRLKNGDLLEIHNYQEYETPKSIVTIEGKSVPDGIVTFQDSSEKFEIKDSKINKVIRTKISYATNKGDIVVEQEMMYRKPIHGDFVYQNNSPAQDGKYRLGFLNHIIVQNGRVVG